jgi:hypothetical protein
VRGLDRGAIDDEVTRALDVHDEVIAFDLANRADLFATFLEKDLIADRDLEVVGRHLDTMTLAT